MEKTDNWLRHGGSYIRKSEIEGVKIEGIEGTPFSYNVTVIGKTGEKYPVFKGFKHYSDALDKMTDFIDGEM